MTYISFPGSLPYENDSDVLVLFIHPLGCNLQLVLHPKYILPASPVRPRLRLPKYPDKLGGRNDAPKTRGVTLNVRARVRCASESEPGRGQRGKTDRILANSLLPGQYDPAPTKLLPPGDTVGVDGEVRLRY